MSTTLAKLGEVPSSRRRGRVEAGEVMSSNTRPDSSNSARASGRFVVFCDTLCSWVMKA